MMAPRFKGKPNFDFSQPCPLCGYEIQPNELMRLASHIIQCPKCGGVFDEMGDRKPVSTLLSGAFSPPAYTRSHAKKGGIAHASCAFHRDDGLSSRVQTARWA